MLNLDQRLSMAQVRALLGGRRNGRPVSPATLHRWYSKGMRGVVLQTEVQGGIRYTTQQWLDEFFAALKVARDGEPAPIIRTPTQRQRQSERAGAELDRRMTPRTRTLAHAAE